MADTFTTITTFINSPPGQLAAGGVLGGIVWKFFEHVGDALNEKTNREIAHWLRVKHVETGILADEAMNWPGTFSKVFDRVFGEKHLSWKCFSRSLAASSLCTIIAAIRFLLITFSNPDSRWWVAEFGVFLPIAILANAFPDYISLLKTRYLIGLLKIHSSNLNRLFYLIVDLFITSLLSLCSLLILGVLKPILPYYVAVVSRLLSVVWGPHVAILLYYPLFPAKQIGSHAKLLLTHSWGLVFFYPAFFACLWSLLYAASGFILKAARRFDIGFDWFNRRFDIDRKPLQSMGLVAGTLVAVIWWAFVSVRRFV